MTINERVSPKKPLFAEVHNVPDDYRFTTEELDRIISGDMFTPRQDAIMARELQQYRAAAEPVAWTDPNGLELLGLGMPVEVASKKCSEFYVALYAAPQVTSVPGKIDLLRAHYNYDGNDFEVRAYQRGWNDCVAAAPAVQAEQLSVDALTNVLRNAPVAPSDSQGNKRVNSPVIPDSWLAEAERLAELHGASFVLFRHGQEPVCADPSKFWFGYDPAAPKQEAE